METVHSDDFLAGAEAFKALHESTSLFAMLCDWDVFSAIVFERADYGYAVECII